MSCPIEYKRKMMLQSSHFNGADTYANYSRAKMAANSNADYQEAYLQLLNEVLPNIHGHNWFVTVSITTVVDGDEDYAVNDKTICKILESFNNTNLSVMPCFAPNGVRATTERLAEQILKDISDEIRNWVTFKSFHIIITVEETPDISATVEERIR